MDKTKIMEKISKLMEKTVDNGCTEEEALTAAKMVQRLIAKYHVDMTEYTESDEPEPIDEEGTKVTKNWQALLAQIVANNFCCECVRVRLRGNTKVLIMGHDTDRKTCLKMFNMLLNVASDGVRKAKRDAKNMFGTARGIETRYGVAFANAVKTALSEQCRALALVVPEDVQSAFTEKHPHISCRAIRASYCTSSAGDFARKRGEYDGRNAAGRRMVTC